MTIETQETAEVRREEQRVEARSAAFHKELGLLDLVLMQIVFVVGTIWVGAAAKLGAQHLVFWVLAIITFYLPQAAVVIYLNRHMPLEGGLYQWAKLGFNEFTGFMVAWNLWLLGISVMAGVGLIVTTNLSYALGARWMAESKWLNAAVSVVTIAALVLVTLRGLALGKWVHNAGSALLMTAFAALIVLPFVASARGTITAYHPFALALPTLSLLSVNVFSKLAVGALSGFEYVAILAGESRAPARNVGRSVILAAPVIAVMFILGTSAVLAFVKPNEVDLIGPIPQVLSRGFKDFGAVGRVVSVAILLVACRQIALMSIYFIGNTRLPMVAGWDALLPGWFTRLHARYKTPVNSILFVGAITLAFGLAGLTGVHAQEAFQLIDNAAGVFYAIAYAVLFALPLFGLRATGLRAPLWLRLTAAVGLFVTVLYAVFTIFPIVEVESFFSFAAKIIATTIGANLVGAGLYLYWRGRRAREDKQQSALP